MIVTKLWNVSRDYPVVWEGRDDAGRFVYIRCRHGLVELRAHPTHRPGLADTVMFVICGDYTHRQGPTYGQVKEALTARGCVLPAQDDGEREEIPERPPLPGYRGPGIYAHDWSSGGGRGDGSDVPPGPEADGRRV